ncbi:MAG: N-acetylmuramic acid 6-phosphate etherase, partial [Alphaproteobacteria bacterium]
MGTETFDPRYKGLETWGEERILAALLEGQAGATDAVRRALPQLGKAALAIAERLSQGGRLVYAGAGTSGRLAVQDGVELTPTFGWPPERLAYILAGDDAALTRSVEGAEDDEEKARAVAAERVMSGDAVVAVAASGRTPFTVGALGEARRKGAVAVAIANNPATPLLAVADHPILLDTGPETIAGSTRM